MQKKYHSKGSQIIETYVKEQEDHCFCVGDVCEYIKNTGTKINTTTIYRNLDRMEQEGKLIKFKSPDSDSAMYQPVGSHEGCHEHLHMRCRECGKLYHLEGEPVEAFQRKLAVLYGFVLDPKASSVIGLCKDCNKKY